MAIVMTATVQDLIEHLQLERIEKNIFRGRSRDIGSDQVFGGQVLGQALSAAQETVGSERAAHSLHAYFLRRGDFNAPIVYEVDNQRDGGSFSVRRVVAIQHGRPIFNLAASFQRAESGLSHQAPMPDVPPPDELANVTELGIEVTEDLPEKMRRFLSSMRPLDFRPVHADQFLSAERLEPRKQFWMRVDGELPDDDNLHRSVLAYLSDYQLLGTVTLPHGLPFARGNVLMASLDHALWFHQAVRVDQWLLCDYDSPNAASARGYARGQIFSADGRLVASSAQEGLVRVIEETSTKRRSRPADQR